MKYALCRSPRISSRFSASSSDRMSALCLVATLTASSFVRTSTSDTRAWWRGNGLPPDGSGQEQGLADASESGCSEHIRVDEPAELPVAAERLRLVVGVSHRRKDPAAVHLPLLDLGAVFLDVRAEALEVGAEPVLDRLEPRVPRVGVGVDTAQLEEVVADFVERHGGEETGGLVPI